MEKITEILLNWYASNQRELPWRASKNPYHIWLSEIILQQTRVDQGTSYYLKFISEFPTVFDLANAEEESVLKLWQGLGYYSRARNLRFSAKMVVERFNGIFPSEYDDLLSLKGVGPYTAAAIASIAFNKPTPVVDGNVFRVISRLCGSAIPIDLPEGYKFTLSRMSELISKHEPGNFNQAVMELGATVCKPVNPECLTCPINTFCHALSTNQTATLPIKAGKTKVIDLSIRYAIVMYDDQIVMRLRGEKGIWQGLYDFPEILAGANVSESIAEGEKKFNTELDLIHHSHSFSHLLSHRKIEADAIILQARSKPLLSQDMHLIRFADLHSLPIPKLVEKMLSIVNDLK